MLTYYPIASVAFKALVSILNLIRLKRKDQYFAFDQDQRKTDIEILKTLLPNEISAYIKKLFDFSAPLPNNILNYPFNNDYSAQTDIIEYKYRSESDAYLEIAHWKASNTFANFSLDNLKLIVSALLLEKSVIFFSSDITNLTATLNTFLGLLSPFKYVCTIIPALPSNLVTMCGAPVPTIIGINRNEEYFARNELAEYSDNIFIFLDSKMIYIDETNKHLLDFPTLDFLTQGLEETYTELNQKNSSFFLTSKVDTFLRKKSVDLSGSIKKKKKEEKEANRSSKTEKTTRKRELIEKVFRQFRERLERNVARYLPYFSDYNPGETTDEETNKKIDSLITDEKVREFFYAYKITQGFGSFPYSISSSYMQN